MFVLAGGIGGLLMGVGFDRTGTYRVPLAGFFLATAISVALFARLGPYRFPVASEEALAHAEVANAV
jgi:cyanate permease